MDARRSSGARAWETSCWLTSEYLREQSFMTVVVMSALSAWLWVGCVLQEESIDAGPAIGLMVLVGGTCWLTYRLHARRYLWAVATLLAAELVFISAMVYLLRDPDAGHLFVAVIVTGILSGPLGACVAAAVVTVVEFGLLHVLADTIPPTGLGFRVALNMMVTAVCTQVALGLHDALASAERSGRVAIVQLEEARRRRGELSQALKSLDLAWTQLQRVNSELSSAREAAEAALRRKGEFAAYISHELRTSLNLVLGFSETMVFSQHSYGVRLPPPYLRDVTEIYRNSRHLLALIDDVLDLTKLDAGRMGLRRVPMDLVPILREATEMACPLVERKGLELVLNVPSSLPSVFADQARIRQVVLNLLSNAVRATSRGRIVVRAAVNGDEIVVEVSDTGVGITPENLTRVFDDFQQVEGAEGVSGAAGLGLAISKRIIALHGGRMWAESTAGVGSTFAFSLPLPDGVPYSTVTQSSAPASASARPAIALVAEPESDEVKLLQRHLEQYTIIAAPSLKRAAKLAAAEGIRAIVVNAAMSAFAAEPPAEVTVPLIACPLPGPDQARRTMGVSCFLQKPFTAEAIRNALRRAAPQARVVLVVDDDPASIRLIERMLGGGKKTYEVVRAYSGREALARVRAQAPDAIILDLAMSDGDGRWLAARLREQGATAQIPIVVITGRRVEEFWRGGPIGVMSSSGFTPTETLRYLAALLDTLGPSPSMVGSTGLTPQARNPA